MFNFIKEGKVFLRYLKNKTMNTKIFILATILFSAVASAQVKIGGTDGKPNESAMLDIEATNKGVLLPRVALSKTDIASPLTAHVAGMTVYNTASTKSATEVNGVVPGFYYNDGTKWNQMVTTDNKAVKFFYMPSITFDTSQTLSRQTKDLYTEYKKQFSLPTGGNHVKSTNAPADGIPYFTSATDLYYYVTDYDPAVFSNIEIDDNGVMTYDVTAAATDCTLINVVFVVK